MLFYNSICRWENYKFAFLLLARYVPNVAKRSIWDQCKKKYILRTDTEAVQYRDFFEIDYLRPNIPRSRSALREVTWRHRSRDHSIRSPCDISYWWSIVAEPLSVIVFEISAFKHIWVQSWPFRVTWRHRSCNNLIPNVPFPIGALL